VSAGRIGAWINVFGNSKEITGWIEVARRRLVYSLGKIGGLHEIRSVVKAVDGQHSWKRSECQYRPHEN
jgi:hypothetical protein